MVKKEHEFFFFNYKSSQRTKKERDRMEGREQDLWPQIQERTPRPSWERQVQERLGEGECSQSSRLVWERHGCVRRNWPEAWQGCSWSQNKKGHFSLRLEWHQRSSPGTLQWPGSNTETQAQRELVWSSFTAGLFNLGSVDASASKGPWTAPVTWRGFVFICASFYEERVTRFLKGLWWAKGFKNSASLFLLKCQAHFLAVW